MSARQERWLWAAWAAGVVAAAALWSAIALDVDANYGVSLFAALNSIAAAIQSGRPERS